MNYILIIEDDTDINNMIAEALAKAGYSCKQAFSGTEGLLHVESGEFSLILMDLMLPGLSGEELLPKIREKTQAPVIVISAKNSLDSKVSLLTLGAEDYITKPFDIRELLARISVQLRRFGQNAEQVSKVLKYKDLELNTETFCANIQGVEIPLTKQEYKILELFLTKPDRIYSKQDIYDYAWEDYYIGEDKTVNVHISNIRKKLKSVSEEEYIETVWGIGFKLTK